jgi:hypothetical protein
MTPDIRAAATAALSTVLSPNGTEIVLEALKAYHAETNNAVAGPAALRARWAEGRRSLGGVLHPRRPVPADGEPLADRGSDALSAPNVVGETPAELQRQIRLAADYLDLAVQMIGGLPPVEAFPPSVAYRASSPGAAWTELTGADDQGPGIRRWLVESWALVRSLRDAADQIALSRRDGSVWSLDAAIGLAVYLTTGDVRKEDVRRVLRALNASGALARSTGSPIVTRVQSAAGDVVVGRVPLRRLASSLRSGKANPSSAR